MKWFVFLVAASGAVFAQAVCQPVLAYTPCELVFELDAAEARLHPNPYWTVDIRAEVRSPRFKTYQAHAFYDGANRMVIRFTPTSPGAWDFKITSNLPRYNGKEGKFEATPSDHPGFVQVRNVRHFAYEESKKPHLWMGDTLLGFGSMERAGFDAAIEARGKEKFNHLRGYLLGEDPGKAFPAPDRPNIAYFQELDKRVRAMNERGLTADLVLGHAGNQLARLLPDRAHRDRFARFVAARYSGFDVTWQMVEQFETYDNGRAFCKELGLAMKLYDPMAHPRSTHAARTSAPLGNDGWMDYIVYDSDSDALNAVERQVYAKPFVNAGFSGQPAATGAEFRRRLWRAAMSGQYLTSRRQGESPEDIKAMTVWRDLFATTRYWDLEPYFDLDSGRAMALEGIEYLVYIEKPAGPIEVLVEKHGYDVYWINPATGEATRPKDKDWKGEKFVGEPPNMTQDWVLHLSRDGKKEGMLKSYKFEARPVPVQEVETQDKAVPFVLSFPASDTLSVSHPTPFEVTLKRQTRATRLMTYLVTGEVTTSGQGYRVLGAGAKGQIHIPPALAKPGGVMVLRVTGLNANGKAYAVDRVFRLTP
ncbi:MAG: DUF4038 domain-containing protein [Bryobacterales bacterium]|nr:DUF4038 domain-containing protein [Bryobacterales bacterium]